MNRQELIALYDQEQRRGEVHPELRREVRPYVVRHIDTSDLGGGLVSYSDLSKTNAEAAIREQMSYFEGIGQDFEWKLYDYDKPSDLRELLESLGFTIGEPEAVLVLDLETAPELLRQPVQHDVRRITDQKELGDVQIVEQEVWDEDASWVLRLLRGPLANNPEQMSVYVAYVEDQAASAAWIYFPTGSQFASLWGGATISRYRKRGLFTALLAVRAQEARARGVRFLTVDAMPMSRPILENLGFELMAFTYPCKWSRNSLEKPSAT